MMGLRSVGADKMINLQMEVTHTRVTMSLTVRFRSTGNKNYFPDPNGYREYDLPGWRRLCSIEAK